MVKKKVKLFVHYPIAKDFNQCVKHLENGGTCWKEIEEDYPDCRGITTVEELYEDYPDHDIYDDKIHLVP